MPPCTPPHTLPYHVLSNSPRPWTCAPGLDLPRRALPLRVSLSWEISPRLLGCILKFFLWSRTCQGWIKVPFAPWGTFLDPIW